MHGAEPYVATVVGSRELALDAPEPAAVLPQLRRALQELLAEAGAGPAKLAGVGVAMPGLVDPFSGAAAGFLPWSGLPVRALLEQELGVPVRLENDANALALAEARYGAGKGMRDLLCVTLGIGIGAGCIVGGELVRGSHFGAGEIGHACLQPDGPLCACGRRGCLEALAGDAALTRMAADHGLGLLDRTALVQRAQAGDPAARLVLAEAGRWVARAIDQAIQFLDPALIILSGEATFAAGDLLLQPLRQELARIASPALHEPAPVVAGSLGPAGWVRGAAALVLDDLFRVPHFEADPRASRSLAGTAGAV